MDMTSRLRNALSVLRELSSLAYQQKIWVAGLGPEVSSYEEAICRLLDDTMFEDILDKMDKNKLLDGNEIDKCRCFIRDLDVFIKKTPANPCPADIVYNEEWENIRNLANEVATIVASHSGKA